MRIVTEQDRFLFFLLLFFLNVFSNISLLREARYLDEMELRLTRTARDVLSFCNILRSCNGNGDMCTIFGN